MLLHFSELGSEADRTEKNRLVRRIEALWDRVRSEAPTEEPMLILDQDLEVTHRQGTYWVQATRRSALPLAQLFVEHGPPDVPVKQGTPAIEHEQAIVVAKARTGIELSTSRVRLGFTRGHLMDIVVLIPLDVDGAPEQLQAATEIYLENRLGSRVLDEWVNTVGVSRIARTKGLVMAADSHSRAESYPLTQVALLLDKGMDGVLQALPHSLFGSTSRNWTALDIECSDGLQGDRRFAFTAFPEALKSALEGMPFCSKRFTKGEEIFTWFRWPARLQGPARQEQRKQLEDALEDMMRSERVMLAGNGLGKRFDYLDLWVIPEPALLERIAFRLVELCQRVELGFYDSCFEAERIVFTKGNRFSVAARRSPA